MTRFALDDLIRAGKVRYTGTSTYAAWQVVESIAIAKELGLNRFICENNSPANHLIQLHHNLYEFIQ